MDKKLQWGSDQPGHVVFLVDLSGSMENKIDYVIDALQSTCKSLVTRCVVGRQVKNRVSVSIFGYNYHIVELLKADAHGIAVALSEARKEGRPLFDKNGIAKPEFQTCMRMAFEKAKQDIEEWIVCQRSLGRVKIPSPIVINITDGEPYEGDDINQDNLFNETLQAAQALMRVETDDGNVRIFNIHHDPQSVGSPLRFPVEKPTSSPNMAFLYDASSVMTEDMIDLAHKFDFMEAAKGSHCMISNESSPSNVSRFIEFGSSGGLSTKEPIKR